MAEYIAQHGIPQRIRTDPVQKRKIPTVCKENCIKHIVCPIKAHLRNGKVARKIRTIIERLRVDIKVVLERNHKNLAKIVFALRNEIGRDGKSAFERHKKQKPNTLKSAMVNEFISDRDPNVQIEKEDFSPDVDSTVLIHERTRGSKLEGTFARKKARIVLESGHTITILPDKALRVVLTKTDVAIKPDKLPRRGKVDMEEEGHNVAKMTNAKSLTERRRTLLEPSSSSEEENAEVEMSGEVSASSQVEKYRTDGEGSCRR